jgi:1-acyl-sn-glycerol-3-phosphate acyltransferase
MWRTIDRCWRIVGTGVSFAAFGAGGLALRVIAFPALGLLVRQPRRRTRLARDLVRCSMRAFVELMRVLGVMTYRVQGLERLQRRGLLVVANHPTLVDIVLLLAFVRDADVIVKSALWRNPFTVGPVSVADYVRNDSGIELLDDCIERLGRGNNLIIFPEGTRTPRGGAIRMQRGAAQIAVRAGTAVTPVVIRCTPPTLSKGEKWWQVPERRFDLCLEVKSDIETAPMLHNAPSAAMAARNLTTHLEEYFTAELAHDGDD